MGDVCAAIPLHDRGVDGGGLSAGQAQRVVHCQVREGEGGKEGGREGARERGREQRRKGGREGGKEEEGGWEGEKEGGREEEGGWEGEKEERREQGREGGKKGGWESRTLMLWCSSARNKTVVAKTRDYWDRCYSLCQPVPAFLQPVIHKVRSCDCHVTFDQSRDVLHAPSPGDAGREVNGPDREHREGQNVCSMPNPCVDLSRPALSFLLLCRS